jgi:aryl carrier-like protein
MVLLSVFAGLLGRYTGLTDIVVGTPVSTRISDEDLAAIGPFLNMLPVRLDLGGDPSLADILARTREEVLSAFEHRGVPFERLVQELGPARHLDHTPLFQNVFAFQESPSAPQLRDLHTRLRPVEPAAPKYELTVIATGVAGEIEITVQGDRMACDAATLQLFAANLDTVLAGALHDPARPFVRLPVLGVIEAPEADGPPILSPPAAWSGPIIAPRTALEEAIATAWCAVLGVAEVDVRRNFFEVGGDSLLLLDLHATVRATVAAEVTLADLFRFPSVETLAQALTNDGDDQTAATAAARGARRRAHLVRHAGSPGRS